MLFLRPVGAQREPYYSIDMTSSAQPDRQYVTVKRADPASSAYIEAALARLRAAGLRITQPRIRLLTELSRRGEPMSIEELHQAIGADDCDVVTVYRCMSTFEDHDVVRRSYRYSGTTLYERKLGEPPRYRVVCKSSNRVDQIDAEDAIRLEEAIREIEATLRGKGYTQISHIVEFFAIYPEPPEKGLSAPAVLRGETGESTAGT